MVEIVTYQNKSLYGEELNDMFKMRYRVAKELGWELPDAKDGLDIDQFDREDTVYFLEFNDQRQVKACARLNPTTKPNLLSDIFPEFCELGGIPAAFNVYEYSRYMVEKAGQSKLDFVLARARITLAINEYCLENAIDQVTVLTYMKNYPIASMIWNTRPLGLPRMYEPDNAQYIAALSDMTEEGLAKARAFARIKEPVASFIVPMPLKFAGRGPVLPDDIRPLEVSNA